MTKRELIDSVFYVCGGKINNQTLSRLDFISDVTEQLEHRKRAWFSVQLPDGDWLMHVTHSEKWGWDYFIPYNEDAEKWAEELYMEDMK